MIPCFSYHREESHMYTWKTFRIQENVRKKALCIIHPHKRRDIPHYAQADVRKASVIAGWKCNLNLAPSNIFPYSRDSCNRLGTEKSEVKAFLSFRVMTVFCLKTPRPCFVMEFTWKTDEKNQNKKLHNAGQLSYFLLLS